MRQILNYILLLPMLAVVGCREDATTDNFTLSGIVVSAPDNSPIVGASVYVSNGTNIVSKEKTTADGNFNLTIDKSVIDDSYKLYIEYPELNIQKIFDIRGYNLSDYDYGFLVLYNSENPYDIPTFTYGSQTYFVHPGFESSSWAEALKKCINLEYMGYTDWILPTYDELNGVFKANLLEKDKYFWSATLINEDELYNKYHSGLVSYVLSTFPDNNSLGKLRLNATGTAMVKPVRYNNRPNRNFIISDIDAQDRKNVKVSVSIIGEDLNNISEKGVCWATISSPTKENNYLNCGSGQSDFSITLSDLPQNVRVYIRPYYIKDGEITYGITLNTRND